MSQDKELDDKNSVKKDEEKKVENNVTSPEKKEEEDDEELNTERHGVSYILQDGSLVEMLYDVKKCISKLAVYKDGKVSLEDKVKINDFVTFKPFTPNQSILKNKYILFPSEVSDYQNNESLYCEVREFVDKYVKLPEAFLSVVAVYIMMSWVFDKFQNIPYLRCVGLWGTGKSRVLSVAGHLCYKTVMAGGSISNAALFRTLDLFNPTLVFDEAELSERESTEMRQVLRQGYSAGTPVSRMDKSPDGQLYIKTFNVFGPKIIASQARFNDVALESRCLTAWMYPLKDNNRPIELSEKFKEEALLLRNKLIMFRFRNHGLVEADEESLKGISLPRLKQTGLAVVSVAKIIGVQPLKDVVMFLGEYEKELNIDQADSVENDILLCMLDLLTQKHIKDTGKIRTGTDLTERFNSLHYEDYSNRESKEYSSSSGLMKYPGVKVSAKKIGGYVRKMGFKLDRDGKGFYLQIHKEYQKIQLLSKRYGMDSLFEIPEKDWTNVRKIDEIKSTKEQIEEEEDKVFEIVENTKEKSN